MNDVLFYLRTGVRQKQLTLEACLDGFSVPAYMNARAKSSIEEELPKSKKKAKTPKESPVKIVTSKDILHPELYERLRAWRYSGSGTECPCICLPVANGIDWHHQPTSDRFGTTPPNSRSRQTDHRPLRRSNFTNRPTIRCNRLVYLDIFVHVLAANQRVEKHINTQCKQDPITGQITGYVGHPSLE